MGDHEGDRELADQEPPDIRCPGAGAGRCVQFMGRSQVNERMKKRPPKYPAKAADIARMRGEPPNARGVVRRPASARPGAGQGRTRAAAGQGRARAARLCPWPRPPRPPPPRRAAAPEPEVDDRVFGFAVKKLSEQEIRDRGFGIPKWSPYHRNTEKVGRARSRRWRRSMARTATRRRSDARRLARAADAAHAEPGGAQKRRRHERASVC